MSPTSRSSPLHLPWHRMVGALGSALAVAVLGTAAIPPATAAAAGVADDRPHLRPANSDPADLPTPLVGRPVTYRWDGTRWVRSG